MRCRILILFIAVAWIWCSNASSHAQTQDNANSGRQAKCSIAAIVPVSASIFVAMDATARAKLTPPNRSQINIPPEVLWQILAISAQRRQIAEAGEVREANGVIELIPVSATGRGIAGAGTMLVAAKWQLVFDRMGMRQILRKWDEEARLRRVALFTPATVPAPEAPIAEMIPEGVSVLETEGFVVSNGLISPVGSFPGSAVNGTIIESDIVDMILSSQEGPENPDAALETWMRNRFYGSTPIAPEAIVVDNTVISLILESMKIGEDANVILGEKGSVLERTNFEIWLEEIQSGYTPYQPPWLENFFRLKKIFPAIPENGIEELEPDTHWDFLNVEYRAIPPAFSETNGS